MNAKQLIKHLESAGLEPFSYSGRGMFGKQCVGVGMDAGQWPPDGAPREGVKKDSLGMGIVYYWPDKEWP